MTRHKYADVLESIARGDDVVYERFDDVLGAWIDECSINEVFLSMHLGDPVRIKIFISTC